MRRIMTALLCLAIPGLLLLGAWEGYRFSVLSGEVASLEKEQKELLEANRDAIGRIAFETSPDRVAEKAKALELVTPDPSSVTRLSVVNAAGGAARSRDESPADRR